MEPRSFAKAPQGQLGVSHYPAGWMLTRTGAHALRLYGEGAVAAAEAPGLPCFLEASSLLDVCDLGQVDFHLGLTSFMSDEENQWRGDHKNLSALPHWDRYTSCVLFRVCFQRQKCFRITFQTTVLKAGPSCLWLSSMITSPGSFWRNVIFFQCLSSESDCRIRENKTWNYDVIHPRARSSAWRQEGRSIFARLIWITERALGY